MSIPTEAIEAAARAMRTAAINGGLTVFPVSFYERNAELTLTAAAPYIQAAALRDAAESFQGVMIGFGGRDPRTSGSAWLRARADQLEGKTK